MIRRFAPHMPVGLSVAGLACLTAAAWVIALPLGLAAAGASLLLIEWRVTS